MDAVTDNNKSKPAPTRSYSDLHDHISALDKAGLLIKVDREINKDTEMHPLVRWQFRGGIPERERKAFLFKNVVDAKGRKYDIPVAVGALAANREIYRLGIGCPLDKINETWTRAIANPVAPNVVQDAPCHEMTVESLAELPIPISTPGWDIAPFTTLSPLIGAGHVAAFAQAWLRPPRVHEIRTVASDIRSPASTGSDGPSRPTYGSTIRDCRRQTTCVISGISRRHLPFRRNCGRCSCSA